MEARLINININGNKIRSCCRYLQQLLLINLGGNMKNEKKVVFLTKQVSQLENELQKLREENTCLSKELESNKRSVLLKEESLQKKEIEVEEQIKTFKNLISEAKTVINNYRQEIKNIVNFKKKYQKQLEKELKRITTK